MAANLQEPDFPETIFLSQEEKREAKDNFKKYYRARLIGLLEKAGIPPMCVDDLLNGDTLLLQSDRPSDPVDEIYEVQKQYLNACERDTSIFMINAPKSHQYSTNMTLTYEEEEQMSTSTVDSFHEKMKENGEGIIYVFSAANHDSLDDVRRSLVKFIASDKYKAITMYFIFNGHDNREGTQSGDVVCNDFLTVIDEETQKSSFVPAKLVVWFAQCYGYVYKKENFGDDRLKVSPLSSEQFPQTTIIKSWIKFSHVELEKNAERLVQEVKNEENFGDGRLKVFHRQSSEQFPQTTIINGWIKYSHVELEKNAERLVQEVKNEKGFKMAANLQEPDLFEAIFVSQEEKREAKDNFRKYYRARLIGLLDKAGISSICVDDLLKGDELLLQSDGHSGNLDGINELQKQYLKACKYDASLFMIKAPISHQYKDVKFSYEEEEQMRTSTTDGFYQKVKEMGESIKFNFCAFNHDSLDDVRRSLVKFIASDNYMAIIIYFIFNGHGYSDGTQSCAGLVFNDHKVPYDAFLKVIYEETQKSSLVPAKLVVWFAQCYGCYYKKDNFGDGRLKVYSLSSKEYPLTTIMKDQNKFKHSALNKNAGKMVQEIKDVVDPIRSGFSPD